MEDWKELNKRVFELAQEILTLVRTKAQSAAEAQDAIRVAEALSRPYYDLES